MTEELTVNPEFIEENRKLCQILVNLDLIRRVKKNKKDDRYMTWFDVIKVSQKAQDRINKIIKEDRQN